MLKKGITTAAMLLSTSCGILQVSSEKENKGKNNLEFENEGDKQVNENDDIKIDVIINNKNTNKIVEKMEEKERKQLRTVKTFKEEDIKARKIKANLWNQLCLIRRLCFKNFQE